MVCCLSWKPRQEVSVDHLQVVITSSVRKFSLQTRTFVLYKIYPVIHFISLQLRLTFITPLRFSETK